MLYSWKTSWCCCRSRTSVLFSGVTVRTLQERLTQNIYSVPSSSSALCWCARWRQVCLHSHLSNMYIWRINPYRFPLFPQTDNRSFFVISMSKIEAQLYELMAQTVSEQTMWVVATSFLLMFLKAMTFSFIEMSLFSVFYIRWQEQIAQRAEVMSAKPHSVIPLLQHEWVPHYFQLISA